MKVGGASCGTFPAEIADGIECRVLRAYNVLSSAVSPQRCWSRVLVVVVVVAVVFTLNRSFYPTTSAESPQRTHFFVR